MDVDNKTLGVRVGSIKAAQIRGAPDYPTQNLYPCSMYPEPHVFWAVNNLGLTEGIVCRTSGWVSFAPAMVSRMAIKSFRVWACVDAFKTGTQYKLALVYVTKDGENVRQVSDQLLADEWDRFMFDIPLEHVDRSGWFTCAMHFELATPLENYDEIITAHADKIEHPCEQILLRGTYLEIKG